jgi:CHAT domain-containing protein
MAMLSNVGAPANGGARKAELRAFGVNWEEGNAAGLPPLDNAADEATTVAEQFGIVAELNGKATRAALLDALQSARMVHVATHGYLNVAAPAFQAICMSPTAKDDGVVQAYELVGMDLRGCDLITLSACETALGRFDRLGNIRGLPAALFMAGARTIIGTLWSVESHCAQYFFSILYQRLRAGDSKLDAFVAAQAEARKYYPIYGDWGAFYYAGWW